MSNIFVITGQTATGKTKFATELAKTNHGELINADSRQIYKYLDIVSGKDLEVIKQIPIHLYDIVDPKTNFSSHEWVKVAQKAITQLFDHGKTPIIVGGTYLYLAHLLYGIETDGVKPDWNLRKELSKKSVSELQSLLKEYSPQTLAKLNESDSHNPRRLIRKIEVAKQNKPLTSSRTFEYVDFLKEFEVEFIGLYYANRAKMRKALKERVMKRLEKGAIEEVKALLRKGYQLHDPGLSANACLEIYQYLTGEISYEQLIDLWVTIEMQYAKRQLTFMKQDKNINWRVI